MTRRATVEYGKLFIFLLLGVTIVGYAIFASRDYLRGPQITIIEPSDGAIMSTSSLPIKGQVKRVRTLLLNGRSIVMDEEGNWSEIILIYPGPNTITLEASDRFKHTTSKTLIVMGNFEKQAIPTSIPKVPYSTSTLEKIE